MYGKKRKQNNDVLMKCLKGSFDERKTIIGLKIILKFQ